MEIEQRRCKFCGSKLSIKIDDALPKEFQGTCSRNCWADLVEGKVYKERKESKWEFLGLILFLIGIFIVAIIAKPVLGLK